MKAQRLPTKNNNYLINIIHDDKIYNFYVDSENKFLKNSDHEEWEWACETWGDGNYILQEIDINKSLLNTINDVIEDEENYKKIISKGISLEVKEIGYDELLEILNKLNDFVDENFELLWKGASMSGKAIEEDYYAPRRIQINETRLHRSIGIKYASGFKYDDDSSPTEKQVIDTCRDLQILLDEYSKDVTTNLKLTITNSDK